MKEIVVIFGGDHDRAKEWHGEAMQIAQSGQQGRFEMADQTLISVVDQGSYINVLIDAPMLPDFQILVPRASPEDPTKYFLDLYGYNHRKDAMFPAGRAEIGASYPGYPFVTAPEWLYISDGIGIQMLYARPSPFTPPLRLAEGAVVQTTITSAVEDLISTSTSTGTTGGFATATWGAYSLNVEQISGTHFAAVQPYGVDRSSPDTPVYRAAVAYSFDTGTRTTETYTTATPNPTITYAAVYAAIAFYTAGKTYGTAAVGYVLDDDIIVTNRTNQSMSSGDGFASAPLPVLIPLGNNRVFAMYRKIIPTAGYKFGGRFTLAASVISGTSYAFSSASVTSANGVVSVLDPTYFVANTWDFGSNSPSESSLIFDASADNLRLNFMFAFLARSSRFAVPLSQSETVFIGRRSFIPASSGLPCSNQIVLFSVTPVGITQKSVLVSYWDQYSHADNPLYNDVNPKPPSYGYNFRGMCTPGGATLRAYFVVGKSEDSSAGLPFYYIGTYCFTSFNGGATWDSGVRCTINMPDGARNYRAAGGVSYMGMDKKNNKPIYMMPFTEFKADDPNVYRELPFFDGDQPDGSYGGIVTVLTSTDGVVFTPAPVATSSAYIRSAGPNSYIGNPERGFGSLLDTGNHYEGYRPSPYRHLPDYYGTARPICRDDSNDYGR